MPEDQPSVKTRESTPDDIRESVAAVNLKCLGEATAYWTNALMAEHVAQTQAMNQVRTRMAGKLAEADAVEAASIQKILSGNDFGQQLAQLGTIIAQLQQSVKGAQTTPPTTP